MIESKKHTETSDVMGGDLLAQKTVESDLEDSDPTCPQTIVQLNEDQKDDGGEELDFPDEDFIDEPPEDGVERRMVNQHFK